MVSITARYFFLDNKFLTIVFDFTKISLHKLNGVLQFLKFFAIQAQVSYKPVSYKKENVCKKMIFKKKFAKTTLD